MISDILFEFNEFILEIPNGVSGGNIYGYSLDGLNYDFNSNNGGETSSVFIN